MYQAQEAAMSHYQIIQTIVASLGLQDGTTREESPSTNACSEGLRTDQGWYGGFSAAESAA